MVVGTIVGSQLAQFGTRSTLQAQASCIPISTVSYTPDPVSSGSDFDCLVTVGNSAGSRNIACGLSVNGGWPQNVCPSSTNFKGWSGSTARFGCNLPTNISTSNTLEMVGFDFSSSCGPGTGMKVPFRVSGSPGGGSGGTGPSSGGGSGGTGPSSGGGSGGTGPSSGGGTGNWTLSNQT